jgi:predicted dehydrogenase
VKVLFVGLGGIGQRHLRNLRTLLGDKVEVLAYRVRRLEHVVTDQLGLEAGANVEDKYAVRVVDDLDACLAERPDAVFVCNPTSLHVPVALKAARAGCHLFIEKPLAHSCEGVDELLDLVERRRLVGLVGYQMRFHPCFRRLQALLREGAVGRVLAVRVEIGEYLPGWHPYEDYRQMYAARSHLGGGVILSQIHELDYLYALFGRPRRVFCLGGHLSSLEIDVEDVASVLMEHEVDGRKVPVHLHQDYVQRPPSRTCEVIGDAGKILVDFRALTVQVFDGRGQPLETRAFENFQRNQLFLDEMSHFLACVRGEQTPVVSVRDGAQSLRMALAAKHSMTSGQVVGLD